MSLAAPERYLRQLLFLSLFLGITQTLFAQSTVSELPQSEGPRAYLVTYGPGEIYWQRFGHNAIWLREPGGLDHGFNFGFFDFNQENFLLRFVQGRMLYFAAAMPMERELATYRREGRSVRVQELNLSAEAYERLRSHLLWHVQPENREYLYDYYQDNCSTRLRDALDLALNGAISAHFTQIPAHQTLRDHTRRSAQSSLPYYLGLEGALGRPIDRSINRWEEMFLPAVLSDAVGEFRLEKGQALVLSDRWLDQGEVAKTPSAPSVLWPRFLALGLLLGIPLLFLREGRAKVLGDGFALAWILVNASIGAGLLTAWGFTDHEAARDNANVLLFSPVWLLVFVPRMRRGMAAGLLVASGAAAAMVLWPDGQYLADTTALVAPIHLCLAFRLWRQGSRPWSVPERPHS